MNDHDPGSDFILSAIQRARAEREAHPRPPTDVEPTAPQTRTAQWDALMAFTPDPRHLERHLVRTLRASADAKPFDIMRTKLLHQMRSNGWRRVALASPDSGCGKTLLTLNLGLSMARQSDLATMLVELDMRRPTMARTLGLGAKHQFSEVLSGRAASDHHMARIGETLAVATHHRPEPAAAELLASKSAGQMLDRVEADFAPDVMLFDLTDDPHEQHDLAPTRPELVGHAMTLLDQWLGEMMHRAHVPTDPMWQVIHEGGALHSRGQLPAYLDRLRATGRAGWADHLAARHPEEATGLR